MRSQASAVVAPAGWEITVISVMRIPAVRMVPVVARGSVIVNLAGVVSCAMSSWIIARRIRGCVLTGASACL